jgi:hypothetical protein
MGIKDEDAIFLSASIYLPGRLEEILIQQRASSASAANRVKKKAI